MQDGSGITAVSGGVHSSEIMLVPVIVLVAAIVFWILRRKRKG
jgi:hypothetical protein